MKQVKQLDFSGQNIYCGIDVHKKSWAVCLRNEEMELKRFSQPPSVEALASFLTVNYPSANYKAAYEAGYFGFSYQRDFSSKGISCIVVNPSDIPTMDKEKQQKTDTRDCRKISKCLSTGMMNGVYVPTVQQQDDRCILRNYQQFVGDQTRCKNRIKSWLSFQGIIAPQEVERYWSRNYINWLKQVPLATPQARTSLDLLIKSLEESRGQVLTALRVLRQLGGSDRYRDQLKLIRSVPGVGELTALLLLTEIGDVGRFGRFDQLCSFIGLIPQMHCSGEQTQGSRLTSRGHPRLRHALIETSWKAVSLDPALTMAFCQYCKRMKKNQAIIKIARKLLNRIYFVMKHQKSYVPGVVE